MPFSVISSALNNVPQNSPTPRQSIMVATMEGNGVLPKQSVHTEIRREQINNS